MDNYKTCRTGELSDTIAASATAAGRAGVAIVRVSGPLVQDITQKILHKSLTPRVATCATFYDANREVIDLGLAIYFQAPHSFTGEDILELHGHGGPVVVDDLLTTLTSSGVRLARPGEFSERAFLNDKIDLTQAEAIADLIDSSSKTAARSALRSLQGVFSEQITELKQRIIQLRVQVEAILDFPEEEIDTVSKQRIQGMLSVLQQRVAELINGATQGCLLRDGLSVVIIGPPNVGKSTLLNTLSRKQTAIVTEIPGTTRDVMRERICLDDIPLHIIDTAGLRDSDDVIEQEGIRRAWLEVAQADHILYMFDVREPPQAADLQKLDIGCPLSLVANKIDTVDSTDHQCLDVGYPVCFMSAKTGIGIDAFKQHLKRAAGYQESESNNFIARRRHLTALQQAQQSLEQAQEQLNGLVLECVAEELRLATVALGEITGEFTADDLLGEIFSTFCIGK
jgi:tRNA modification GTPase